MRVRVLMGLGLGWLAASCGGVTATTPFSPVWQNDGGKSIAAVQQRLGAVALPTGASVAVGVTKDGIVGIPLAGGTGWSSATKPDVRPTIAGDLVVATGGGRVFALDAMTGKSLWSVAAPGLKLRGAGDSGELTAVSLAQAHGASSSLWVIDRAGKIVHRLEAEVEIGTPAIIARTVFVPWSHQYVSAIDLDTGEESGRLLTRSKVSHAVNVGGELYFGERGMMRFDDAVGKAATQQAHHVDLPERELPGDPSWLSDGASFHPPNSPATERIRLFARPKQSGDTLKVDGERFAATYFRVVLGMHSVDGTLRWVRTLPNDVIGGAAGPGGFALCDEAGKVWLIDGATGADAGSVSIGKPLESCVVRAAKLPLKPGPHPGPLAEQIAQGIEVEETQMVMAQRFLMRELGTREEPEVTRSLIELAAHPRTPPMLRDDARKLLAARRNGADHMIAALERRYDFLEDVLVPPPIAPLADALAAMNNAEAAPLLVGHLSDPVNSPDDVEHAARALAKLATSKEVPELRTFFAMYRAAADDQKIVAAVLDVARTLVKLDPESKALVKNAGADPLTHPDVKTGIAGIFGEAPKKKNKKKSGNKTVEKAG